MFPRNYNPGHHFDVLQEMKKSLILMFIFLSAAATPLYGAITEDSIRGQWAFKFTSDGFSRSTSSSFRPKGEYSENGTIAITVDGRELKPEIPFRIQGRWELNEETVVITVTNSTAPKFIQVGSVLEFKLHKVTETEMYYEATPTRIIYKSPKIGNL